MASASRRRHQANVTCWPAQARLEAEFAAAVEALGWTVQRGHPVGEHGFIDSQRAGIEVFKRLPPDAPVVVVEAVWQYSHHVLPGLRTHRGPILTVANWSGEWPGLVGMLNLNASLTKAGVRHCCCGARISRTTVRARACARGSRPASSRHDTSHVRDFELGEGDEADLGRALAAELRRDKAIMGVFDEGCMGMYNAIIPDELLNPTGRLQGAALASRALFRGDAAGG